MPINYSKDSLLDEEKFLRRIAETVEILLKINLERQLKIAEADTMNGEEDADNRA